ncbi:MAG TPA: hypothetical protein VG095_05670, partial [Chthoniobacterales bacterium]|nr:hypothetical protein [Chthoniobacterales bacterium]
ALRLAFRFPNLVQDDARQHVFWMARFRDPTLFPNDLIADYFQAVAPNGYSAFYLLFAQLGLEPLWLSKLLPAILGVATAWIAFLFFRLLLADSRAAFAGTVLLTQLLWLDDDIISATPRAFAVGLLLAFLYFALRRKWIACVVVLAVQAVVYPQTAFLSTAILGVRLIHSRTRTDYVVFAASLFLLGAVVFPFASSSAPYGPVVTRSDALALPEFQEGGRSEFFVRPISFWLNHSRSGLFPDDIPLHFLLLAVGGIWLCLRNRNGQVSPLLSLGLAALLMWSAAHLFLFRLHLPGRYSHWPVRILVVVAAAFFLGRALARVRFRAVLLTLLIIVLVPHFTHELPNDSYVRGKPRELLAFLRTQPKDITIAMLSPDAGAIPVFAQRSVLVSAEHAIPYHTRYYRELRERGRDLLLAHLTSDPVELRKLIEKRGIDLFILQRVPITSDQLKRLAWYKDIAPPELLGISDQQSALRAFAPRCTIWEDGDWLVLDARVIADGI